MLSAYGFPFLLAALVSYILTPYIKTLAFKIGAIDKPDNRKVHKRLCRVLAVWLFILPL